MLGGDYTKAFIEAFGILHSYKFIDNTTSEIITQKIDETLDKYLKMEDLGDASIKYSVDNLLKNINSFSTELELPETTLNVIKKS